MLLGRNDIKVLLAPGAGDFDKDRAGFLPSAPVIYLPYNPVKELSATMQVELIHEYIHYLQVLKFAPLNLLLWIPLFSFGFFVDDLSRTGRGELCVGRQGLEMFDEKMELLVKSRFKENGKPIWLGYDIFLEGLALVTQIDMIDKIPDPEARRKALETLAHDEGLGDLLVAPWHLGVDPTALHACGLFFIHNLEWLADLLSPWLDPSIATAFTVQGKPRMYIFPKVWAFMESIFNAAPFIIDFGTANTPFPLPLEEEVLDPDLSELLGVDIIDPSFWKLNFRQLFSGDPKVLLSELPFLLSLKSLAFLQITALWDRLWDRIPEKRELAEIYSPLLGQLIQLWPRSQPIDPRWKEHFGRLTLELLGFAPESKIQTAEQRWKEYFMSLSFSLLDLCRNLVSQELARVFCAIARALFYGFAGVTSDILLRGLDTTVPIIFRDGTLGNLGEASIPITSRIPLTEKEGWLAYNFIIELRRWFLKGGPLECPLFRCGIPHKGEERDEELKELTERERFAVADLKAGANCAFWRMAHLLLKDCGFQTIINGKEDYALSE